MADVSITLKPSMNTDREGSAMKAEPTPWRLFGVFCWISAVTVGGGYAMVPVIESALEKRGWTTESEFYDLFATAQSFPGPLAFTTALVVGRKLCGAAGGLAGGFGVLLPPLAAIMVVGALIGRVGKLPAVKAFLDGAGATVPGLVAAMVWKIAKSRTWNFPRILGTALLAGGLILAPGASLPIFFCGLALLYFAEKRWSS
jgi:chromate transporter